MKYGSDLLQLIMNALPPGAKVVTMNIHAYGGDKASGTDTSLEAFSDQQRLLGTEEITVSDQLQLETGRSSGDKLLTQIRNGFVLTEGPEDDEEVAVNTSFGVSFKDVADLHGDLPEGNYFLPVLDMLFHPDSFRARVTELQQQKVVQGRADPLLEFLRKYKFTALDTGKSLHLVAKEMVSNDYRAMEKFLAQALMFPSLGVDFAWVGHSIFRQWMGLRISANGEFHTKVPTINAELTDLLRTLDQNDQIGQARLIAVEGAEAGDGLGF